MLKEAVLKRKMRKTRGKGKRDRLEWGLFSKSNPKKVLKWFGPDKPTKKEVAKEEARIHAFSSDTIVSRLIKAAEELDGMKLYSEADEIREIIKNIN